MQPCVALHPEGVDRNHVAKVGSIPGGVALHPEGVDRNINFAQTVGEGNSRPPPGGRG